MKEISVPSNWLDEIDGMTVADAIEYLKTLPQDHKLNWWMEGDTHGCDVECELVFERPYTEEELAQLAAERKAKKVKQAADAIAYNLEKQAMWVRAGNEKWADEYRQRAEIQRKRLEELK